MSFCSRHSTDEGRGDRFLTEKIIKVFVPSSINKDCKDLNVEETNLLVTSD